MIVLQIKDLVVSVDGKKVIDGLNLEIKDGEIHALMGPNGSGKSTLSYAIAGHPKYKIESGSILFKGEDILALPVHERAKRGLFLSFQYPQEIPGVSLNHYLYTIAKTKGHTNPREFKKRLDEFTAVLGQDKTMLTRDLNVGFSGGEKKKNEILQLLLLKPELAILDETDSGLDIDALRLVSQAVNSLRGTNFSAIVITHYPRMLNYLKPDVVHIFKDGKIIMIGDARLADEVEAKGYEWVKA